jgi:hypothetical protein
MELQRARLGDMERRNDDQRHCGLPHHLAQLRGPSRRRRGNGGTDQRRQPS